MLVGKIWIKKFVVTLAALLVFAIPTLAADVRPLHFDNISTDLTTQQAYWDSLMTYKMYGETGIEFIDGGNIKITDKVGRFGTTKGDFIMIGDNNIVGGPILIGGNIDIRNGGSDEFSTGPTRVTGRVVTPVNLNGTSSFKGPSCVAGGASNAFANAAEEKYFEGNYANCPSSVPKILDNLSIPKSPANVPEGSVVLSDINANNYTYNINVPDGKSMYDVYVNEITLLNNSTLAIQMPKNGRLTRIFVRKLSVSSQSKIIVQYRNDDGSYSTVSNDEYAGNLLFFIDSDFDLTARDNGTPLQGTYLSTGTITVKQQLTLAGQLLGKYLKIAANFDGSGFRYVPFDPASFSARSWGIVYEGVDYIGKKQPLSVSLNKTPNTDVSFKYCFMFKGNSEDGIETGNDLASEADLVTDGMPLCKNDVWGRARFLSGDSTLADPITVVVADDHLIENEENFQIVIDSLEGAVASEENTSRRDTFDITIIDDDKTPVCQDTTIKITEDVAYTFTAGTPNEFPAFQNDGVTALDSFGVVIIVSPVNPFKVFDIPVDLSRPISTKDHLGNTTYTPGLNGNGVHYDSLSFAVEVYKGVRSDACKMYFDVTPVNDAPVLDDVTITIRENTPVDSVLLQLVATDVENDKLVYSIDSGDVKLFALEGNIKDSLVLKGALDYETQKEHKLKVKVKETETAEKLEGFAYVTIKLIDENEKPKFDKDEYEFTIKEHTPVGLENVSDIIGTVLANDPDSADIKGKTIRYTYKLVSPAKDDDAFMLGDKSGVFSVKNSDSLNYEKTEKYVLWAYATDKGGLYDSAKVTIIVEDINEEPAFKDDKWFYQSEENMVKIPEDAPNGNLLTFEFSDPDFKSLWATNGFHKLQLKLMDCTQNACGLGSENELDANVNSIFAVSMKSDSTHGVLSLKGASNIDYEKDSTYNMMVEVRDNVGLEPSFADTIVIRVRITNVNESPKFDSTKYTFNVNEHLEDVVELGNVHATDVDFHSVLKYSFADGKLTDPSGKFSIDESNGRISTVVSLNYEEISSYAMKVYVTDNDAEKPLKDSVPVTINVVDVNETPWADAIVCKIEETAKAGTSLDLDVEGSADKCVVLGKDLDTKNPNFNKLTYSWADSKELGADIFAIHASTGSVTLAKGGVLNFESDTLSFKLTVKIADNGGLDSTTTVTINVVDVNEPPVLRDTTITVPETTSVNSTVLTLIAKDPEVGEGTTGLNYRILDCTLATDFKIATSKAQGVVRVKNGLDFETKPEYKMVVEVDDGELKTTATVTVIVTDVNEEPYFDTDKFFFTVEEHNEANAVVDVLVAYDDDNDERYNQLTYSLLKDTSGHFAVSKDGIITVPKANVLNYESVAEMDTPPIYEITVVVTDGELHDTATVKIEVVDINEKPTLDDASFSVKEHLSSGATVGKVKATDLDYKETFVYKLLGTSAEFSVGANGEISTSKELNYESKQQYEILVEVSDKNGNARLGSLKDTATVTINIIDVNEKPSVANQSFDIEESATYPDGVGTVKGAKDKDELNEYFKKLSYFISDTIVDGVETKASQFFEINETSGKITVKKNAVFDYETKGKVYYLKLTVRDHKDPKKDDPALETYALITINILNVPEPPEFNPKYPNFDVDENSPLGTEVGELSAKDNDEDETLIYTLFNEDGSVSEQFQIFYDDTKATIKVKDNADLDYETKAEYKVLVIVSDKTNLKDTAHVTITINDVNEKPTLKERFFELEENSGANYKLGKIQSGDLDTAKAFIQNLYEAVDGDTALFDVNSRGEIFAKQDMDFEEWEAKKKTTFVLNVKVVDHEVDSLNVIKKMYIDLIDVNEKPEVLTDTLYVSEDAKAGSKIGMLDATDPDGPTTFSFTLVRTSEEFKVAKDGSVTVKSGAVLDYESRDHSYTIYVAVQDAEGETSETKPVVVIVSDVNEPPTLNDTILYVYENASVDTIFGKIFGSDPDIYTEAFRQLSYEMLSKKDSFDFLPDGSAKLLRRLDYEADSVYVRTVRVTDGTFYDTANVTIKVINVVESTYVEIILVDDPDSTWHYPDTIYTNIPEKHIEWLEEDKKYTSDTVLVDGPNIIKRCYWNRTKDYEGCDSVVIYYSNATPLVKVYSDPNVVTAENVYTIVEQTDKSDTNYYVNTTEKKVFVSVTDTAAGVNKKFEINLELDTVSVPKKTLNTLKEITKEKPTLRDGSEVEVVKTPVNGNRIVVSYVDTVTVDGEKIPVKVSYETDLDGNEVKTEVVNEKGKVETMQVITVSYTTKIDGKDMVVSYKADAITGEVLNTTAGGKLTKADCDSDVELAQDAIGTFTVSYDYDDHGNKLNVKYVVNEKGEIVTNEDGDIGYSVSYSYTNKFGNTATKSVYIVLDQLGPKVEILDPVKSQRIEVVSSNFIAVKWTVNGEEQDTLTTQGLEKGLNAIVRFYRDKAGNEASDTVFIIMKNGKNIEIAIEQPVTEITREKVEEYYASKEPAKNQTYAVSIMNPTTGVEVETLIGGKGIKGKKTEGSGETPYPGLDGHLGPTLVLDVKLPVVRQTNENADMGGMNTGVIGGLATFDDIVNSNGLISLDGVDANNGEKLTVDEYIKEYCVDGFNVGSDLSKANLYDSKMSVKIWVYTTTGEFVNYYSFAQSLNDPSYTNEAGVLKMFFEMKPDKNGDVRNDEGRLIATGSYLYKVDVKLRSELKCSLPPVMDASSPKKGDVVRNDEDLLKSFGYKRPAKH